MLVNLTTWSEVLECYAKSYFDFVCTFTVQKCITVNTVCTTHSSSLLSLSLLNATTNDELVTGKPL